MDNSGKSTIAFLMGVVAGGILGVFFAPKSGKETRTDLHRYIKDAEANIEKKKEEIKEAASRQLSKVKDQMSRAFRDGMEEMETKEGEDGAGT